MSYDEQLLAYRSEIDQIDKELVALMQARMQVVAQVGALKKAHGRPILDSAREDEIIARLTGYAQEQFRPYIADMTRTMLVVSKLYQQTLLTDTPEQPR